MKEPAPTPVPKPCDLKLCAYHPEVIQVREWKAEGLGDLVSAGKWLRVLLGGALIGFVTLAITALLTVSTLSHRVGRLEGELTTRVHQIEAQARTNTGELERIDRSNSDSRATILVQLGRISEQLENIDSRITRIENSQSAEINRRGR